MPRHLIAVVCAAAVMLLPVAAATGAGDATEAPSASTTGDPEAARSGAGTATARTAAARTAGPAVNGVPSGLAQERYGPVLLELFTSQGCSACPPADQLLARLAPREDLLPLSFHVSYWDHMGWSDPFAIAASVRRQRGYARAMRSRSIFTPQLIVQGAASAVGSDEARIMRLIAEAPPVILLGITREPGDLERFTVRIPALPNVTVALELWAVLFASGDQRYVPQGENAGHLLRHVNVVREAGIVGVVEATPAIVEFDRPDIPAIDGLAMILQARNLGPVVGTGVLALR